MVKPETGGLPAGKTLISRMGLLEDQPLGFNSAETFALKLSAPGCERALSGKATCARWR